MIFETMINGIPVKAFFSDENVEEIYIPFLRSMASLQKELDRRILIFLAAPPGTGKSTLTAFLKDLSLKTSGTEPITVIGMDGFHRRQEYLLEHSIIRDGKEVRMVDVKGTPETFDLDLLRDSLEKVTAGEVCDWPEYDRMLHNPVYRGQKVSGDIILLEGNYLLLEDEGWRDLRKYADYTIRITADPEKLRRRLVERKVASGTAPAEAEKFVDFSDLYNAKLVLERSGKADLELCLMEDDSYQRA